MFIVTGANGQTGSVVAKALLGAGQPVRVVLRQPERAAAWKALGAQAVVADQGDKESLIKAFDGATSAYLMNPPAYHAPDLFSHARDVHAAMIGAAKSAGLKHVVALSSVGAQHASGTGNILTTHDFEQQLVKSGLRVAILRAANFMENWAWSLPVAMQTGTLPSMFHPLDRAIPSVSVQDIGATAASLLMDTKTGIVELHGPKDYSPNDAAKALSQLTGKTVQASTTPRHEWSGSFASNGLTPVTIQAFCDMFDGINSGLVAFAGTHETRHGKTSLSDALRAFTSR